MESYRSANPGLARCVLRRRCHSGKLRNVRTRGRPVTGHGRARLETQSERLSSFISIVTGHETNIVAYGTLDRVPQHVQCCWRAARKKAVAQLPATTMSSMWTYASRWCMSARVYGAELELSSSSVVPVQRMSMEWAVAGTAMAALDFERRRLGFRKALLE